MSSASQPPRPDPLAQGSLARTPFAHVLVYIWEKRLTGTLAVQSPGGEDLVVFEEGAPAAFRTAGRAEPLRTSLARLFATVEAPYAFYGTDLTELTGAPAPRTPLDPLMVLGAGTIAYARDEIVDATLRRFGARPVRVRPGVDLVRFELARPAAAFVNYVRASPAPVHVLLAANVLPEAQAKRVLYLLTIVKALEVVEAQVIERVLGPVAARRASEPPPAMPRQAPADLPLPEIGPPGVSASASAASPPSAATTRARPATPAQANNAEAADALLASLPPIEPKKPGGTRDPVGELPKQDLPRRKAFILTRVREMDEEDYFQMLGLPRTASLNDVRDRYLDLAKLYHPDRQPPELQDVKTAFDTVFGMLTEANKTLSDEEKRKQYMRTLGDGGGTPAATRKVQELVDAAIDLQKAEVCLRRRDFAEATRLIDKALAADPEDADYNAFKGWLLFSKDGSTEEDFTLATKLVDKAIATNDRCERAFYAKGMFLKKLGDPFGAEEMFSKAVQLNSKNLDAVRELRVLSMRNAKDPKKGARSAQAIVDRSASGRGPAPRKRSTKPPPPSAGETVQQLFGKLFGKKDK